MKSFVKRLIGKKLLFALSGLSLCFTIHGQGLQDSLKHDEDDIISSIAPYPADVRDAILDVSQYPQVLVKLERLQSRTSQAFQDQVSPFSREVQEKFYDLARYPDLVNQLAVDGKTKSPEELKSILSAYPQEVAVSVNDLYPSHLADLESMNRSYQQSQEALQGTIKSLPEQSQADFQKVIGMPDVMNLLTDRIDLTVSLGEAYKSNPQEVRQNLTSLNGQISAQNAKDLDDYKKQVSSDPQLQDEMKKSAQDFANNYSDTDEGSPAVVNNYYNSNPYPYWFGYPYWYPSPIWFPQPLYYHTGFYLGAGGNLVVVGLPSYAYSNWFFNSGYRNYPRIYGRYNSYYTEHRSYRANVNVYRGYNSAVREHFSHVNNNNGNGNRAEPNRGRSTTSQPSHQAAGNTNRGTQNTATSARSQNFRNSINIKGPTLNTQPLNNFHQQQYHQQSWQGLGGAKAQRSAPTMAQPQRSAGGGAQQRSSGGGAGHSTGGGAKRGR